MDVIISDSELISVDKSKKYVILVNSEQCSLEEISKLSDEIQRWIKKESDPVIVVWGRNIKLLEVVGHEE